MIKSKSIVALHKFKSIGPSLCGVALVANILFASKPHSAVAQTSNAASTPSPVTPSAAQLIGRGSNQFAVDLYRTVAKPGENLFFSPFSISAALAMTSGGAKGVTLEQIKKTLHLPPGYHAEFRSLLNFLTAPNEKFELTIANRLWTKKGKVYYPTFLELMKSNYAAEPEAIDFWGQPEPSRVTINKWVEKQTKDKIKDLIPKDAISRDTDLVLTNAIYFKAKWLKAFQKESTKSDEFFTSPTNSQKTSFMTQKHLLPYAETATAQILGLPYVGDELSLLVFLPHPDISIEKFETSFSEQAFEEGRLALRAHDVVVTIPKFKSEASLDLKEALVKLGMTAAFEEKLADFNGVRDLTGGRNMYISKVVHKAFVDVDEAGTEAAAATAVLMVVPTSMRRAPIPPKIFKANRPFLYSIVHKKSGMILFLGKYARP